MKQKLNIAGLSLGGGRKDNFYFCLMEYFPEEERWFLKSMLTVLDEQGLGGDEAIYSWAHKYALHDLVVDFPLTNCACQVCDLVCPGHGRCPVPEVVETKTLISDILERDSNLYKKNPKAYERMRVAIEEFDMNRGVFHKESTDPILTKRFKRRLKKGYLPYWNRPIDLWIWTQYYDHLMELFGLSYDSFGRSSLMLINRFFYLKRHFPKHLNFFESDMHICLLELYRAKMITKECITRLNDLESGVEARLDIIKSIENNCQVFIYEKDLEIIVKNQKAFRSFLLALVGRSRLLGQVRSLPDWSDSKKVNFLAPIFSQIQNPLRQN